MTAALERGEWSAARPGHTLPPGKTGTHFTRGWVGPRARLDGRKISSPPGFDPGPSSPQSVAIPTEPPGYIYVCVCVCVCVYVRKRVCKHI